MPFNTKKSQPDMITVAKGIANGLPLGATICSESIADSIPPGSHGSTFGGNPLSVAAANAVLKILNNKALDHIIAAGTKLSGQIKSINSPKIKAVRGKGLMIGVEFIEGVDAKMIASELLARGVIAGTSGNSVIRLLPPYIISDKEILLFIKLFIDTLELS